MTTDGDTGSVNIEAIHDVGYLRDLCCNQQAEIMRLRDENDTLRRSLLGRLLALGILMNAFDRHMTELIKLRKVLSVPAE